MPIGFDGREISAGPNGDLGGGVFTLPDVAGVDAEFTTADGVRVYVAESSRGVVVTELGAGDYATAWRKSLIAAQQALDVFSARGLADLHLSLPQHEHLATYSEGGTQVLRLVGVSTLDVMIGPVTAVVDNAEGNPRPQVEPVSVWHESMRYYRQAQISDDLFESFRSLWLGFENLLDSEEPQRPGERESSWLKRALAKADAEVGLQRFLPPERKGQAVNSAYRYFYDETRTHLFHAKASRNPLLPHEQAGTNLLVDRHQRLTELYLELLESATGVRRPSGMLVKGGFNLMMQGLEAEPKILITDDTGPEDPDATTINPESGTVVEAPAQREPVLEVPFLRVFMARLDGAEIAPIGVLRKTAYISKGVLISGHIVEGQLEISDLNALEVQWGSGCATPGCRSPSWRCEPELDREGSAWQARVMGPLARRSGGSNSWAAFAR